jgi:hypothetical protein
MIDSASRPPPTGKSNIGTTSRTTTGPTAMAIWPLRASIPAATAMNAETPQIAAPLADHELAR